MLEVSLKDPLECKADSLSYKLIASKPRDGASDSGGFRRFVLQVGKDLNISLPEALRTGGGTGGEAAARFFNPLQRKANGLAVRLPATYTSVVGNGLAKTRSLCTDVAVGIQ